MGKKRAKPTPSTNIIEKNIANVLKQWNNVEYEGIKLIPRCAIDEINKLLTHVKKGCLSHIPPSGGTGRNEGFHRVLNKTLKKSRIGIQFAVALLGVFFYMWNEKQLSGDKTKKTIRVVPPVESHFEKPESSHLNGNEVFRLVDYSHLSGAETCANDTDGVTEANSTGGMMTKLNEWLNGGHVSDSSSDDDDNYSYCAKDSQAKSELPFAESQKELIDYSRSMEELWSHLESAGKFEKFQPKHVMFAKSGLTLLNSDLPSTREYSSLDGVLANYDMARVNIPGNGNCFFKSVAHAIKNTIIPTQTISREVVNHLDSLGLLNVCDDVCGKLRKLVVDEWITNPDQYKPFLTGEQTFETEARLFLNDGHFATQLGNSMPLTMGNVLKLPVVVVTEMENLPVLPITPRESIQCLPIFIAFDQSGAGHYDAVVQIPKSEPSCEVQKPIVEKNEGNCCRCGQGAKKKEKGNTSCDQFKKRCKCFQALKGCTEKCQCLGCENPHGKKIHENQKTNSSTGTRKRWAADMTTGCMSGKDFMAKRPRQNANIYQWTFLEELVLVQLLQTQFSNSDIDMAH